MPSIHVELLLLQSRTDTRRLLRNPRDHRARRTALLRTLLRDRGSLIHLDFPYSTTLADYPYLKGL